MPGACFCGNSLEPSYSQTSPHSDADWSRPMTSLSQARSPFLPCVLHSVFRRHLEMHAQCVCHLSKVPGMLLVTRSSAFAFNQIYTNPCWLSIYSKIAMSFRFVPDVLIPHISYSGIPCNSLFSFLVLHSTTRSSMNLKSLVVASLLSGLSPNCFCSSRMLFLGSTHHPRRLASGSQTPC